MRSARSLSAFVCSSLRVLTRSSSAFARASFSVTSGYLSRTGDAAGVVPLSFEASLPGLVPQLAARRKLSEDVSAFTGRPSSGLFPEEVETLRALMTAQPAKQRASMVAERAGALGPKVAQGLGAAALELAGQMESGQERAIRQRGEREPDRAGR